MMKKTISQGIRALHFWKAAPLMLLLLLQGNQVLAQAASSKPNAPQGMSALEILGYVAMIIGVIALAWIIGAAQSKGPKTTTDVHPGHRRHYDHPNDPHFRKLKKKTS
jgi:hypothetical protein